ncbi:2012_t:CDS:10 [Paraglomus brasilianum]|uniref:2012_t:CDS:1 n=1 Tax=Paraglomus brasilianum TaxID=144538 RepID=A0A9N8WD24_9GLOM|nr:2012_t:CDS:10 [Paraglomus brasilianum]
MSTAPLTKRIPTIKEISAEASKLELHTHIALKIYLRTISSVLRQAEQYKLEQDVLNAFKFYMKFAVITLDKLPAHPEYNKPESKKMIADLKRQADKVLTEMAILKPKLEHMREEQMRAELEATKRAHRKEAEERARRQKEARILDHTQQADQMSARRVEEWSLINQMNKLRTEKENYSEYSSNNLSSKRNAPGATTKVEYPTVSLRNESDGYSYTGLNDRPSPFTPPALPPVPPELVAPPPSKSPPAIPPKLPHDVEDADVFVPRLPPKVPHGPPKPPKLENYTMDDKNTISAATLQVKPEIQVDGKIEDGYVEEVDYKAYTEGGEGLRTIYLPSKLTREFLKIAAKNTKNNLETLGILVGTLSHNSFCITSLIIPKQTATSDSCNMINEEELLECVNPNELTLGWIHTHPTQTCFMSSIDLHTHSSYQWGIPEAIAIVCAPKYNDIRIFRLSNPPGLQAVIKCTKRGFHPHAEDELFVDISKNGHVINKNLDLRIADLR